MESLSIKGKAGKRRKGKGIFKGIFKFIFKGMSSSEQFPPCFIILPQKFPLSLGFSSKFQGQGDPLLPHYPVTKFPLFLGFSPKIPRPRGGQEKKKTSKQHTGGEGWIWDEKLQKNPQTNRIKSEIFAASI